MRGPVKEIDTSLRGILPGSDENDLFFATQDGIELAVITAGAGSDTVIGNNLRAAGISVSLIDLGGGEDFSSNTVIATGTTTGMLSVLIFGGSGDDTIIARGASVGVEDVFIEGAAGNDTFDLENGTGSVNGGVGSGDLLILDGDKSDYTFTFDDAAGIGNIFSDPLGTDLFVTDIEQFELNGVQFSFDQLFGDNGTPVEVSIADLLPQQEGNTGTTEFVFTVSRTGDPTEAVTVDWAVTQGPDPSADGNDFVGGALPSGMVTIPAGQMSVDLVVPVQGDTEVEPDENFTVTLSNPSVGTLGKATAIGTIENDDEDTQPPQPPEQGQTVSLSQIRERTFEGTDLSDFYRAESGGIISSTFDTKGGRDFIIGRVSAGSNVSAAIFNTQIDTGDDNDFIAADSESANFAIDFSEINTGEGNDIIRAVNTNDRQSGIRGTTINAGSGDDEITVESDNFAIQDTLLNGEDGNDTFELRSALNQGENNGKDSTINGGEDEDLLILGSSDFRYFYELGSSTELTGTITGEGTLLQVEGVELFQFANQPGETFAFEQLFAG